MRNHRLFHLTALAVALVAAGQVSATDTAANGQAVVVEVTPGPAKGDKLVGGQEARYEGSEWNWNYEALFEGVSEAESLLQDLSTSLTIRGGGEVAEEVIGGSYIHANKDPDLTPMSVSLKSTRVVVDGTKIKEGVTAGNKFNSWTGREMSFRTGSTAIRIENGADIGGLIVGGDHLKQSREAQFGTDPSTLSGVVDRSTVEVLSGSVAHGIVGGGLHVPNNVLNGDLTIATEVKSSVIRVDGAAVEGVHYPSDGDYAMDVPVAIVAGALAQGRAKLKNVGRVGASEITVSNGSTVRGDILLGGLLILDGNATAGTNAEFALDSATLTVTDSTLEGSVFVGHRTVIEKDDGTSGELPVFEDNLKSVGITLRNAVVKGTVEGLGDGRSRLTLSGVNRVGAIEDQTAVTLEAGAENNLAEGGKPIVTFTDASVDLSGVRFDLYGTPEAGADVAVLALAEGTKLTGTGETTVVGHGTFVDNEWTGSVAELEEALAQGGLSTGEIDMTPKANGNAETLSQVRLASVAMVAQAAEFVADAGLPAMNAAAETGGISTFGTLLGGKAEYDTGSSFDLESFHLMAGAASRTGNVTAAGFVEAGLGSSEASAGSAKADGDHVYYGVGAALRAELTDRVGFDTALRVGMSRTEFDGRYAANGTKAKYESDAPYATFHLGADWRMPMAERFDATLYGRWLAGWLDGDERHLKGTADAYEGDSVLTHALRAGVRFSGEAYDGWSWRLGAAFEHAAQGDAEGKVSGIALDTPSLGGNAGIFEAGVVLQPAAASAWRFDLGLKGYVGDREGVTGSATAVLAF